MSLKTWKKEFYPKNPSKRMTKLEAVQHSLRKWQGITEKNLGKHNVWGNTTLYDGESDDELDLDAKSCALCVKYYPKEESILDNLPCVGCPLFQALGHRCDVGENSWGNIKFPFSYYVVNGDSQPMIRALKKTLKMVEKEMQ